jgi:catechol 2,3-dioxygenase-like lactoylglutathione lyase family enzyme
MARGVIDWEALKSPEALALRDMTPPRGLPFNITKIGHVVLVVSDVERSVEFYTRVLGFRVSDVYPDTMMPGRMVFMRCNADHHGVALVGQGEGDKSRHKELHHMAFEVASIDEVFRAREHLKKHSVPIDFEGRRRAGVQVAVEFRDPDDHCLEIYWGLDQVGSDGHIRPPEEWREVFSLEDALDNEPPGQDTTLFDPSLRKK